MFRLWLVIGFFAAVFYVYSVVSAALAVRGFTRGLPKAAWIAVAIVFPVIGGALWFAVGRERADATRAVAPDDDADFLASLGKRPGGGSGGGPGAGPAGPGGDSHQGPHD